MDRKVEMMVEASKLHERIAAAKLNRYGGMSESQMDRWDRASYRAMQRIQRRTLKALFGN